MSKPVTILADQYTFSCISTICNTSLHLYKGTKLCLILHILVPIFEFIFIEQH
jgi:hypothetical protein